MHINWQLSSPSGASVVQELVTGRRAFLSGQSRGWMSLILCALETALEGSYSVLGSLVFSRKNKTYYRHQVLSQVSKFQRFKVFKVCKFQCFKIPKFQDSKIPRFQDSQNPNFQSFKIPNTQIQFSKINIPNTQIRVPTGPTNLKSMKIEVLGILICQV